MSYVYEYDQNTIALLKIVTIDYDFLVSYLSKWFVYIKVK